ncbi:MAG: IS21-like element helper ATPase IstB [Draconibacterium sp.]
MENLKTKLREFKLAGIVKSIDTRNKFAIDNNISYIEFMQLLMDDELVNRKANSFGKRLVKSKINTLKSLDDFDFNYQPKLNKKLILDLAACRFINENKNIVFMGKPGTGKTHLANAIGLEALKQGYSVLFLHINDLIDKLNAAKADGSSRALMNLLSAADLLILDEIGFKKIPADFIDGVFEVIRKRYESGSIIITSNRNFEDWSIIFGDLVMASAIIDRIVHHASIIKIDGDSFRTKNFILDN